MALLPDEYGNTYGLCSDSGLGYNKFALPNTMGLAGVGMGPMGAGGLNTNYLANPAPVDAFVHRENNEKVLKTSVITGIVAFAAGLILASRGKGGAKILKQASKPIADAAKNVVDDVAKPITDAAKNVVDDAAKPVEKAVEKAAGKIGKPVLGNSGIEDEIAQGAQTVVKKSKYTWARGKHKIKTPQVISKTNSQAINNTTKDIVKVTDDAAKQVNDAVKGTAEELQAVEGRFVDGEFYPKKTPVKALNAPEVHPQLEYKPLPDKVIKLGNQSSDEVIALGNGKNTLKALNAPEVHPQLEYKPLPDKVIKLGNQSSDEVIYLGDGSNSVKALRRASRKPNASGVRGTIKLTETRIPMEGGGNTIIKTNPITKTKVQQVNVDPRGRIEQVTKFDSKTGKIVEDIQYAKGQVFGSTKYDPRTGVKIEETVMFDGGKGIRKYNPETGKLTQEITFKGDEVQSVKRYGEAGKVPEQKNIPVSSKHYEHKYTDANGTNFSTKVDKKTGKKIEMSATRADGSQTIYKYDNNGKIISQQTVNPFYVQKYTDGYGTEFSTKVNKSTGKRVEMEVIHKDGSKLIYKYDESGNLIK